MKNVSAIVLFFLVVMPYSMFAQDIMIFENEGVEKTRTDGLIIYFDNFTGNALISTDTTAFLNNSNHNSDWLALPLFQGNLEKGEKNWVLTLFTLNEDYFITKDGYINVPWLVDNDRFKIRAETGKESLGDTLTQGIAFEFSKSEWDKISSSQNSKFRISGKVVNLPPHTLEQMNEISEKILDLERDLGVERNSENTSYPYELSWEGGIDRVPVVQPLPENSTNSEAVIFLRFEVRPDGTVGRIIPLRKMNPELEREVMSTLRSWRFSSLPRGVSQQSNWGTITFRFVVQ